MLTKPEYGWTDFHLEGTGTYGLSYLTDIPFDWLGQAIHGLETMEPFCVEGFMEPGRFLCLVSYWNCHIILENENRGPMTREDVTQELVHVGMLEFCEEFSRDLRRNLDEWASFTDYLGDPELYDSAGRRKRLEAGLARLDGLISRQREHFGKNRAFF